MVSELTKERIYPWITSLAVGVLCWEFVPQNVYEVGVNKLVDPILTVSTIAVGFILTINTMLISMEHRTVIVELRGAGAYQILLGYLRGSLYVWLWIAITSLIIALIDPRALMPILGYSWLKLGFPCWVTLLSLGFLTLHRVARIMFAILRYGEPRRDDRRKMEQGEPIEVLAAR